LRGPGQKIIGYSFYGDIEAAHEDKKDYFLGIYENLKLMPKLYPGWIMRVYVDLDEKDPIMEDLCELACSNERLDLCKVSIKKNGPCLFRKQKKLNLSFSGW